MERIERFSIENIDFSSDFFYDEVREGFFVTTMMKRYWAVQLKVLSHIARICNEHNIKWYADYGTLIGTVRHEGYIPWDDDLDICMLRPDWLRFFEIAEKELPEEYEILTIGTQKGYSEITGRVVNSHAIDYSQEHMREYYGCPYVAGVDIFPLDGVYDDPIKEADRIQRVRDVSAEMSLLKSTGEINSDKYWSLLMKIEALYSECSCYDAENVAFMPFFVSDGSHKYSKEIYDSIVRLPFENTFMNVMARYDEKLLADYGDYMRIIKGGGLHDYPVYSGQQEILKNSIGHNPFCYTLNYHELLSSVQRYALKLVSPETVLKRKIVALLPVRTAWWNTMKPLWEFYSSNSEEYEVHVLPIFYFDCDFDGNIGQKHDDHNKFAQNVPVEDCEKFDFVGIHPDIIVTQVPFDGYNTSFSVHEFFYSSNLKEYTDELIYVPCYDIEDPSEKEEKAESAITTLVEQPAVICADRVVLQSDKQKEIYFNRLIELTGEDTRNYWEHKIITIREYCGDKELSDESASKENSVDIFENISNAADSEWEKIVEIAKGRKIIIYYISISMLLKGKEKSIKKIKKSLDSFAEEQKKIIAVVVPQEAIISQLEDIDSELWSQFIGLMTSIDNYHNCFYDSKGTSIEHMDNWDAFYGDPGFIPKECVRKGIPVMIQNVDC